jgi:hypothetical protein
MMLRWDLFRLLNGGKDDVGWIKAKHVNNAVISGGRGEFSMTTIHFRTRMVIRCPRCAEPFTVPMRTEEQVSTDMAWNGSFVSPTIHGQIHHRKGADVCWLGTLFEGIWREWRAPEYDSFGREK